MDDRYTILLSKRVSRDLEEIAEYISRDSPEQAALVVEGLLAAIENLKVFPHRNVLPGQSAMLKHPVRSLPVKPYILFFRVLETPRVVRILRVRHGARRRPRRID